MTTVSALERKAERSLRIAVYAIIRAQRAMEDAAIPLKELRDSGYGHLDPEPMNCGALWDKLEDVKVLLQYDRRLIRQRRNRRGRPR